MGRSKCPKRPWIVCSAAAVHSNRKYPLYKTSLYTFAKLIGDSENIVPNLVSSISGFSPISRRVFERFKLADQIEKFDASNCLFTIIKVTGNIDLHPDRIDNFQIGYRFEHLLMRFNEQASEAAGDYFTPPSSASCQISPNPANRMSTSPASTARFTIRLAERAAYLPHPRSSSSRKTSGRSLRCSAKNTTMSLEQLPCTQVALERLKDDAGMNDCPILSSAAARQARNQRVGFRSDSVPVSRESQIEAIYSTLRIASTSRRTHLDQDAGPRFREQLSRIHAWSVAASPEMSGMPRFTASTSRRTHLDQDAGPRFREQLASIQA